MHLLTGRGRWGLAAAARDSCRAADPAARNPAGTDVDLGPPLQLFLLVNSNYCAEAPLRIGRN